MAIFRRRSEYEARVQREKMREEARQKDASTSKSQSRDKEKESNKQREERLKEYAEKRNKPKGPKEKEVAPTETVCLCQWTGLISIELNYECGAKRKAGRESEGSLV